MNQTTILLIDKTKLQIKFEVFVVSQVAKSHGWISDDSGVVNEKTRLIIYDKNSKWASPVWE